MGVHHLNFLAEHKKYQQMFETTNDHPIMSLYIPDLLLVACIPPYTSIKYQVRSGACKVGERLQ